MKQNDTVKMMSFPDFFTQTKENVRYHIWENKPVRQHSHDFFEFFVITENRLVHTFNGQKLTLTKGCLGLVRPGDTHQLQPFENEKCAHFNLSVSPSLFSTLCSLVSSDLYDRITTQTKVIIYKMNAKEYANFNYVINKAQVSKQELSQKNEPAIMRVLTHTFLLYLHTLLSSLEQTTEKVLPDWFTNFLELLNEPEVFNKPLSKIYALSSYSQPRLNTLFRAYTGTTLIDYITKRKISYACNLLKTTNYKILTICDMTGFNSISRFNFVFKSIMNVKPTEYREKNSTLLN